MSTKKLFLVISADQKCRVAQRPQIQADEVAIAINLTFPDHWGKVLTRQPLEIAVPDFAPEVKYEQTEDAEPAPTLEREETGWRE